MALRTPKGLAVHAQHLPRPLPTLPTAQDSNLSLAWGHQSLRQQHHCHASLWPCLWS